MSKCKRCHRDIKNPKSVQNGYGPVCWIKMLAAHPAVIGKCPRCAADENAEDFEKAMPDFCGIEVNYA